MANFEPNWEPSDQCKVKADSGRFEHPFIPGSVVVLRSFDPHDDSWLVEGDQADPNHHNFAGGSGPYKHWIAQKDLEHAESVEELDRQAAELFGVVPKTRAHICPTCTCEVSNG